jgi:hypothetical protein
MKKMLGFCLIATTLMQCGKDNDGPAPAPLGNGTIMGVVRNAVTGERIAIESNNVNKGVYILAGSARLVSQTYPAATQLSNPDQSLVGEYFIHGIPLDTNLPMVVKVEGFDVFEAVVQVKSSIAQRTQNSEQVDINLDRPTFIADIALYPQGTTAQSLTLKAIENTETKSPIADVEFRLTPAESTASITSMQDTANGQIFPIENPLRQNVIFGKTGSDGKLTITGDQLVRGRRYNVEAIAPRLNLNLANDQAVRENQFVVQVRHRSQELGLSDKDEPFEVRFNVVKEEERNQPPTGR